MSDNSWVTEALVQYTRSPVWRTPVNNFIDDNCGAFDADEEMKLEYTAVHNQFKMLVDNLLTSCVQELGVSLEDALSAVKSTLGDDKHDSHNALQHLMKYVFILEDFRSFHRTMVKRNIELDILATQSLQAQGLNLAGADPEMLSAMLRNSQYDSEQHKLAMTANGDIDEETALKNAIAASLADAGMADKNIELEDAQLQEALALSVQAEKEKARQLTDKVEKQVQQVEQHDMAAAQRMRVEKLSAIEEQKEHTIKKLTTHTIEARKRNDAKRRKPAKGNEMSSPPVYEPEGNAQAQQPAPQSIPVKEAEAPLAPVQPVQPAVGAKTPSATAKAALPPIATSGRLSLSGLGAGALPPIQSQAPLRPLADAATNSTPTVSIPAAEPKPQAPTREMLEARANRMREQRARILAQNKAKRHQELTDYAAEKGTPPPVTDGQSNAAAQKQLTVDIARRLREDMVQESTKKA